MVERSLKAELSPGSTIGILGGGQLGRMLAVAASRLGLRTHIYSDARGPAFDVAAHCVVADYADEPALVSFARSVEVVTYEFENVPEGTARILAEHVPVRPGSAALAAAQDRLAEKQLISGLGIAVAPFHPVSDGADVARGLASIAGPAILKTRRLGYDGKGQVALAPGQNTDAAWSAVGRAPSVLEARLAFHQECSVIVARGCDGETAFYDVPQNLHAGGILRRSIVPAPLPHPAVQRTREIAATIAESLGYVGVLAVELFDLGPDHPVSSRFVVNEIAPRVHNSGHWTIDACPVSQFENHIRAVAGWPLGSTQRHSDAEMRNLIGEDILAWRDLAADKEVCIHLYGKGEARDGRKMGHVTRLYPLGTYPQSS